ncbi:MAG: Asp-tRNA(Asn)/Glu-tRNA(Gln) amidotransferase subunit GatA, partial [Pseudonocardiaceae bacterium]
MITPTIAMRAATPAERLATARRQIGEVDPLLHAFLALTNGQADIDAEAAAGSTGPLAGTPIAVKDNICTRGTVTTCGSAILADWIPPYDATVVGRLREAGAVIVGKTNLDEFAMGSSTEFSAFGPTRNPHDLDRVPGGSSGGSAAAVAAGMVTMAVGSDTGGSVRQPASHCGVVGVKPTYGRVSRYGLVAYASSLDQIGTFGATVADAALLLSVLMGHDPHDSTSLDVPVPDLTAAMAMPVEGLRVGVVTDMLGPGVEPEVEMAVRACSQRLAISGATVTEVSLPILGPALSAYYLIATAEASSNLARFDGVRYGRRVEAATAAEMMVATRTAFLGEEVKRRIILGTFALSAGYYDDYYGKAQRVRALVRSQMANLFANHDVLIGPTSPRTAFRLGELIDDPLALDRTDVC